MQCPICTSTHSLGASEELERNAKVSSIANYPSKIQALCEDIQLHREEGKWWVFSFYRLIERVLIHSSVVFSFWRKSLDIVGALLEAKTIPYLRVDGSLLFSKRKTVLDQFQGRNDFQVLLMTLGTGAVG